MCVCVSVPVCVCACMCVCVCPCVCVPPRAADLAAAMALASSGADAAIPRDVAFAGEVGLVGELRPSALMDKRIQAVAQLGFKRILVPRGSPVGPNLPKDFRVVPVATVKQALAYLASLRNGGE